ncbi:alpha/beta hydrolase family protein [Halomonas sp. THAF12]|uniref:alpha/beta hydrolase family protein n=1 Tax=Halomonas sp. B23F22_10 TaxID=3459515 RepID=UPI00373E0959
MRLRLFLSLLAIVIPAFADSPVGFSSQVDASDERRPIELSIWYPSADGPSSIFGGNAVFEGVYASPNASVKEGEFPLVVVSHGGLRSSKNSGAWLGAGLARAGFVAVEVNAPRPASAAMAVNEIWQRPRDMNRTIDLMLGDQRWAEHVDHGRIFVVGFALGGTAALAVSGAEIDVERYLQACAADGIEAPDCEWYKAHNIALDQADPGELGQSRQDRRVKAAVAIDPEYLAAFSDGGMASAAPMLLMSLGGQERQMAEPPQVERLTIQEADRFDAFATCTESGPQILREERGDVALCGASPEARERHHARMVSAILAFVANYP